MTTRHLLIVGILILKRNCESHAQNTTTKEQEVIRQALLDASHRLNNPKCSAFFGPSGREALMSAKIQMAPIGPPLSRPGSTGRFQTTALVIAVTYREFQLILINRLGPFVEPGKPIGGRLYNKHLTDDDFRAFVLLHELGHLIRKFGAEGTHLHANEEHTDQVFQNCW